MPKIFTNEEKLLLVELVEKGLPHKEVAERMAEQWPENWTHSTAIRTVGRLLKEIREGRGVATEDKTLDEMARDERFKFMEAKLQQTARFRMAFAHFTAEDKEVFCEEYLGIVRATDTLTEAEEQTLFTSILEMILALKAMSRKEREESLHDKTVAGEIKEGETGWTPILRNAEKYQREYDQHMKLREKGLESLKMSREQRLKEIRTDKRTLVDLAQELSQQTAQAGAARDIESMSKMRDEELKTLLANGHLLGSFED